MEAPLRRGVVETLTAGFSIVNRQVALVALPVAVDLVLWLGPKVSLRPLLEKFSPGALESQQATAEGATEMGALVETLGGTNVMALLSWLLPSAVGTAPGGVQGGSVALAIGDVGGAALAIPLLMGTGIILAALWLAAIATALRLGRFELPAYVNSLRPGVGRYGSYLILLLGAVFGGVSVTVVATAIHPALGSIAFFLMVPLALALYIYLFFAISAIFIGGFSPLRAMGASIRLFQSSFWPSLGFVGLVTTVTLGMGLVWGQLAAFPWGVAIAIAGNSYIATGLTASVMVYYLDRATSLPGEQGAV
ncbi:MAG: hypothetical protein HY685_00025 [Chloroflexi bacterium]|nr:hypothetical protein [Chloroflexota bacterium]